MECLSRCCVSPPALQECSSSLLCSSVQLCPTPIHLKSSSLQRLATAPSRSSRGFAFCSTSPLQTQVIPSSGNRTDTGSNDNLSAKERRKMRNERREDAKAAQELPWREMVETKLDVKKKKKGWKEDADVNQLTSKGLQWWMISAARRFEFDVAEQISLSFAERFPGKEIEALVPTVPVRTKLKDGSASVTRKKLFEGTVLFRCVMDRSIYDMVRQVRHAYEFFGNIAGNRLQPIIMPAPVSSFNMDSMFQQIREEEEKYEEFKEQCRRETEEQQRENQRRHEEQKKDDLEQEKLQAKSCVLEEGAFVRVLSGPFSEFTGVVTELLPDVQKVKALVTVFGNDVPLELSIEDVAVEIAPQPSAQV